MAETCEEIYISRIESSIRGLKLGTKPLNEIAVKNWFRKLKPLNIGMYEALKEKFDKALIESEKKNKKKLVE